MFGLVLLIIISLIVLGLVVSYHYYMNIRSKQSYIRRGNVPLHDKPLKIVLHGPCASGKSTHARELSEKLSIPVIDSDFHRFYPAHEFKWRNRCREDFEGAIEKDLKQYSDKGWVFDGRILKLPFVLEESNVLIVMDYALIVTFWRLLVRTISRSIFKTKCCNGNVETIWNQLGSINDCLFAFEFKCMLERKERELAMMEHYKNNPHVHIFQVQSPREMEELLARIDLQALN